MLWMGGVFVYRYYCRFCPQGTGVAGTGPFPNGVYRDYAGDKKQPMIVVKAGKKRIWIPLCVVCGHASDSSVLPKWSGPAPKQEGDVTNATRLPFFVVWRTDLMPLSKKLVTFLRKLVTLGR